MMLFFVFLLQENKMKFYISLPRHAFRHNFQFQVYLGTRLHHAFLLMRFHGCLLIYVHTALIKNAHRPQTPIRCRCVSMMRFGKFEPPRSGMCENNNNKRTSLILSTSDAHKRKRKYVKMCENCKPRQFELYFTLRASSVVRHIENINLLM